MNDQNQELHPSSFFDLSSYSHRVLFEGALYPWLVLFKLEEYLKQQALGIHLGTASSQAYLINPELISFGEGTVVEPGAFIQGPCILGKNCTVRFGAYLRGNILAGDGCVFGQGSEVKHSILLNRAHVPHKNYVGDSILGNDTNLGCGVTCANLKLDRQPIVLTVNQVSYQTGLRKFGAVIGDNVQIGCQTVLNPGTLLGKNVLCYPSVNLSGYIPKHSMIKPSTKPQIIVKKGYL